MNKASQSSKSGTNIYILYTVMMPLAQSLTELWESAENKKDFIFLPNNTNNRLSRLFKQGFIVLYC